MEEKHKTRLIQFLGRTTPIILQNQNGPCPLLAICNVLLLKNSLHLSGDIAQISQERLLSLVADHLIDANTNLNDKEPEYVQNQQQNMADAMDLLPSLATGIDVNIKFRRVDDFEFTRECAIFDLLDIPLYHGWIVDPQDHDTANAIGAKSYNTLMGELVALETQNMEGESGNQSLHQPEQTLSENLNSPSIENNVLSEIVPAEVISTSSKTDEGHDVNQVCRNDSEFCFQSLEVTNTLGQSANELSPFDVGETIFAIENTLRLDQSNSPSDINEPIDIDIATVYSVSPLETDAVSSSSINHHEPDAVFTSSVDGSEPMYEGEECILDSGVTVYEDQEPMYEGEGVLAEQADRGTLDASNVQSSKDELTPYTGQLIRDFLKNNASQLTINGLFCLQDGLKERELCVFFRNNHFSTMFKFEGELYLLATDQGYINQPDLVWEKLNEVNGNTVFMTGNFMEFKLENPYCRELSEGEIPTSSYGSLAIDTNVESTPLDIVATLNEQGSDGNQSLHQPEQTLSENLDSPSIGNNVLSEIVPAEVDSTSSNTDEGDDSEVCFQSLEVTNTLGQSANELTPYTGQLIRDFLKNNARQFSAMIFPWFTIRTGVTFVTLAVEIYTSFWQTEVVKLNRINISVAVGGMFLCYGIAFYCGYLYLTKRSRVNVLEKRLLAIDAIAAVGLAIENIYKLFYLLFHGKTSTFRTPASIVIGLYLLCHRQVNEVDIDEGNQEGDSIV